MLAAEFGYMQVVNVLCSHKNIQLNIPDTEGYTALLLAVDMGEEGMDIAKRLLEAGADPNVLTLRRKTCLKLACEKQNVTQVSGISKELMTRKMYYYLMVLMLLELVRYNRWYCFDQFLHNYHHKQSQQHHQQQPQSQHSMIQKL